MLLKLFAVKRKEVVARKKCFACFGEIFGGIGHCVGALGGIGLAISVPAFDSLVEICSLGMIIGSDNVGMLKREHAIVVGMRQFVKHKVWHAIGFSRKCQDVCKLHAFFHGRIAAMAAQPTSSRVVFCLGWNARIFSRKPERNVAQRRHRIGRHHAYDFGQLFL